MRPYIKNQDCRKYEQKRGMTFNPDIHHRKSIRLRGYDYSQAGMYFVTICTHDRTPLFGEIINGEMKMNEAGVIATDEILVTAKMRHNVSFDEFIVMPNHMHSIIAVGARCTRPDCTRPECSPKNGGGNESGRVQRAPTIGDVVRGYKSAVTKRINQLRNPPFAPVWQRNYYEQIIRDEAAYLKIAEYIQTNPQRWQEDIYYV